LEIAFDWDNAVWEAEDALPSEPPDASATSWHLPLVLSSRLDIDCVQLAANHPLSASPTNATRLRRAAVQR